MVTFARPTPPPSRKDDDPSVQALFEEIDAEVKAENFEKFLKRHGKAIIAAVLAVIIGTAAANFYMGWLHQQQQKETALLIAVMDQDPAALSDDQLKAVMETYIRLGKEGHGEGIRLAAGLSEASVLIKKGEKDAAVKRLEQLQNDSGIRQLYRDYALLQKVRLQVDSGDAQRLLNELKPLLSESNPWHLSALQTAAMLDAKLGHKDEAIAKLQSIIDARDTPVAGREEASELLRLYKAM